MKQNLYRLAIEALGSRASKKTVINKFNQVAAHSDDAVLRRLCEAVILELGRTDTRPEITATKDMTAVKSALPLLKHCQELAYREET